MTEADIASSTGTDLAPGLRQRNLPHLEEKTGKVVGEAHEYDKKAKPKVSPFLFYTDSMFDRQLRMMPTDVCRSRTRTSLRWTAGSLSLCLFS